MQNFFFGNINCVLFFNVPTDTNSLYYDFRAKKKKITGKCLIMFAIFFPHHNFFLIVGGTKQKSHACVADYENSWSFKST